MKNFGVVGAGIMGAGIAQVAATKGFNVILSDIKDEYLERGMKGIKKNLQKNVEKGKMSDEERNDAINRIKLTTDMNDFKDADIVIEAASEDLAIKGQIFKKLDEACKPECILASNTSTILISRIAGYTKRAHKVIGMHFSNPVPVMKMVEVIRGLDTDDETCNTVMELAKTLDKVAGLATDSPGFVVNRIMIPMMNEAMFVYQEGLASKEAIDTMCKMGYNLPMGPLALLDMVGLDTALFATEKIFQEMGDPKYRPPIILKKMVAAGHLGVKTGRGFYDYSPK